MILYGFWDIIRTILWQAIFSDRGVFLNRIEELLLAEATLVDFKENLEEKKPRVGWKV